MRLYNIGDHNMPRILSINCHMDNGSGLMTVNVRNVQMLHQFGVAGCNLHAVHLGNDAVSADLLNIADTGAIRFLSIGPLQALADRVGRRAFCQRGIFHQLFIIHLIVMDTVDLKYSLCQGAGFIKYNIPSLR